MAKPSDKISAYDRLVAEVKRSHPDNLTDREANKIARNLMGFCKKVIEINRRLENSTNCQNNIDKQGVNGNVPVDL